jgi:hypothetical protein
LTPASRAIAAAYDLQRERKSVSVRAACERAKVDRGHLKKRYPEAVETIDALSQADLVPHPGIRDRRTGTLDGIDVDSED